MLEKAARSDESLSAECSDAVTFLSKSRAFVWSKVPERVHSIPIPLPLSECLSIEMMVHGWGFLALSSGIMTLQVTIHM